MNDKHLLPTSTPTPANQGHNASWLARLLTNTSHRATRAALLGLVIGGLASGGMYFHDGADLTTAAVGFAGFWVLGFALGYFPILTAICSLLSIGV